MNTRGADTIMAHAGKTHPKYRARYSYQTFLNQRYLKDPTLDRIIERYDKWIEHFSIDYQSYGKEI